MLTNISLTSFVGVPGKIRTCDTRLGKIGAGLDKLMGKMWQDKKFELNPTYQSTTRHNRQFLGQVSTQLRVEIADSKISTPHEPYRLVLFLIGYSQQLRVKLNIAESKVKNLAFSKT